MVHVAQFARQGQTHAKCATLNFVPPTEAVFAASGGTRSAPGALRCSCNARIGSMRLGIGASFLIIAWLCFGPAQLSPLWLCVSRRRLHRAAGLSPARSQPRARRRSEPCCFIGRGSQRINGSMERHGHDRRSASRCRITFMADDLDLFGSGSLYQLLCAARTQMGENILAQWLLAPARLRASFAPGMPALSICALAWTCANPWQSRASRLRIDLHPETLDRVGARRRIVSISGLDSLAAPLLAVLAVGTAGGMGRLGCVCSRCWRSLLVEAAIGYLAARRHSRRPLRRWRARSRILKGLAGAAEAHRSRALRCTRRCWRCSSSCHRIRMTASAALAKLATIVNFVEARRNPILAPFLLLLDVPAANRAGGRALAQRARRQSFAPGSKRWASLRRCCLWRSYAFEHPEDPVSRIPRRRAGFQGGRARPSVDPRGGARLQRCRHRRPRRACCW